MVDYYDLDERNAKREKWNTRFDCDTADQMCGVPDAEGAVWGAPDGLAVIPDKAGSTLDAEQSPHPTGHPSSMGAVERHLTRAASHHSLQRPSHAHSRPPSLRETDVARTGLQDSAAVEALTVKPIITDYILEQTVVDFKQKINCVEYL